MATSPIMVHMEKLRMIWVWGVGKTEAVGEEEVMGRGSREQDMPLEPGQILVDEPPCVLVSAAWHPPDRCWRTVGLRGGNHSPGVHGPSWELDSLPGRKKGQGKSLHFSQVLHSLSNCKEAPIHHLSTVVINR